MIKKCPGCGATMQYSDPKKVGYSPKKDAKLCERCFKLKNYNEKKIIELKYNNDDIINILNEKADNIFFVTDFLSLSNKVIDIYKKIKIDNKVLIINKADYIPNSINKDKYLNWIKETYLINDKIILISAIKNYNTRIINNLIAEGKRNYICGFTNSGKSTIINNLCEINDKNTSILTSLMPNTTLDVIKIKLDDNKFIYDTPGFIIDSEFNEKLYPKRFIKPITLQTKPGDIVSINNEILIKSDIENSFTFYMSNDIKINKVYKINRNIDNKIEIESNSELVIHNYGFINIKNKCTILTNIDKDIIELRSSMF